MPTEISLQEHLEKQIHALEAKICLWEKAHTDKHDLEYRALGLQSHEYSRRLDDLNNENTRIAKIQDSCVPQNVYDVRHEEIKRQIGGILEELKNVRLFQENIKGQMLAYAAIGSVVVGFLSAPSLGGFASERLTLSTSLAASRAAVAIFLSGASMSPAALTPSRKFTSRSAMITFQEKRGLLRRAE